MHTRADQRETEVTTDRTRSGVRLSKNSWLLFLLDAALGLLDYPLLLLPVPLRRPTLLAQDGLCPSSSRLLAQVGLLALVPLRKPLLLLLLRTTRDPLRIERLDRLALARRELGQRLGELGLVRRFRRRVVVVLRRGRVLRRRQPYRPRARTGSARCVRAIARSGGTPGRETSDGASRRLGARGGRGRLAPLESDLAPRDLEVLARRQSEELVNARVVL